MPKFYLVTGFLGAGKTTFLKKFIPSLAPMRMHIIVNEYGKESVDGPLLATLDATLKQINNGSIFCSCKINDFEDALLHAMADAPDCIVVEASGLADPTAIRSIVEAPKYKNKLDYGGSICLVDAVRFKKVHTTARCVKRQIAASDIVLLNKTDKASEDQIKVVENLIYQQKPTMPIYRTVNGDFQQLWLNQLSINMDEEAEYAITAPDISLQRFLVEVNPSASKQQVLYFLNAIAEETYRIKGFVKLGKDLYLVNCVGLMVKVEDYQEGEGSNIGKIVILSGEGLPIRKSLKRAFDQYGDLFKLCK